MAELQRAPVARWRSALLDVPAVTAAQWRQAGWAWRWLIASRASVLPLTLFASLFAGLLAWPFGLAQCGMWLLATTGLALAHATNNLLNDHVDYVTGVDQDNYFRTRYGTHPLAAELMSRREHRWYIEGTGFAAAAIAVVLCVLGGLPVLWLTLAGAVFVLFYTWPLKRWALGELAVLIVWGPLMIGGVHYLLTRTWTPEVWLLGLVYGLGPTVVIFAKHTDKVADDRERGVCTLPGLLGETAAARVTAALAGLQILGALAFATLTGTWSYALILLAALPARRLWTLCGQPRPAAPPAAYPANLWPLWYTVSAFAYARTAGACLVGSAALAALAAGVMAT